MKLTAILLTFACLQVSARMDGQTITLKVKNAPLKEVFRAIQKQTGMNILVNETVLSRAGSVTLDVKNMPVPDVLKLCLKNEKLTYTIVNNTIAVEPAPTIVFQPAVTPPATPIDVKGRVVNENNEPVAATVAVKGTNYATATDADGYFVIKDVDESATLVITGVSIESFEVKVNGKTDLATLKSKTKITTGEEVIVNKGYYSTSRRLNTGSIGRVGSEEISRQPVTNALAALSGRVPGLIISQATGYAGGTFDVQIRGRNSILQGSQPLYLIDGIPFGSPNNSLSQLTNATTAFGNSSTGGINPLYLISPNDIESIEILKDADATAIYGSRGANGVILITTKKGKGTNTTVTANLSAGFGTVTRSMDMMNTTQYLAMRKEAYANDGLVPSGNNASDILLWDSTRYTDLKKLLIGGTAYSQDASVSVSAGNIYNRLLLSSSYHRESTVLPVDLADHRATLHANMEHRSTNDRFTASFSTILSYVRTNLPSVDPTLYISRPPNMKFYTDDGQLNWQEKNISFRSTGASDYSNPLASLKTKYQANNYHINSNLSLSFDLLPGLCFKTNVGYLSIQNDEIAQFPTASRDPFDNAQIPRASFGNSQQNSWIIEPQLAYQRKYKKHSLDLLAGMTLQKNKVTGIISNATNYASDLLLGSLSGAGSVITSNNLNEYKYIAGFGRINYQWNRQILVNLTARRDGSSRFGYGKQFNNFGAVGLGWILSDTRWLKKLPWINFAKIRGSYGTAGNDAIGDYQFLDKWTSSSMTYQGVPVLSPTSLYNANLSWERNRKLELAADISFLKDRISTTISVFRNVSDNQLVTYNLPIQTGFSGILRNLDASVENRGSEITLSSKNIQQPKFRWSTLFNLSFSRNTLLDFPNLESSSYANVYVIGQPLTVRRLYAYMGVDPVTGLYAFKDANRNGTMDEVDKIVLKNLQPDFYGGLQNDFQFKGWELGIFFQFVRQPGTNYLASMAGRVPGNRYTNVPVIAGDRWQQPGQTATVQRFTTFATQAALLTESDGVYSDASFIRCKNVYLTYNIPVSLLRRIHAKALSLYINAQNLFVITGYRGSDPEVQNFYRLPPLRMIVAGARFTF